MGGIFFGLKLQIIFISMFFTQHHQVRRRRRLRPMIKKLYYYYFLNMLNKTENEKTPHVISVKNWSKEIIPQMHRLLEVPNWAPWLAASTQSMEGRANVFPEGQLMMEIDTVPAASLSMNRIYWDGNPQSLKSWDDVAGDPTDYSSTYNPAGNTLVLMSMNVALEQQGKQLPARLINHAKQLVADLNMQYLIGSFRPTGYGVAKAEHNYQLPFWQYCTQMTVSRLDKHGVFGQSGSTIQLPFDPWLRSLTWAGLKPLKEDTSAMVVSVPLIEFQGYKQNYKPNQWNEIQPNVWECGEVGLWTIYPENGSATYTESNLWGVIY
ncbi:hypothetical protein KC726_03390 [Candidatus Woesebacteria bacterium]|nr:hypothetical protein [Candidatus Woesebacteria bacterium]